MAAVRALVLLALVAGCSAFAAVPSMGLRAGRTSAINKMRMSYSPVPTPDNTKETYWETKAPGSEVLGIGKDVRSGTYAAASLVSAAIGAYCISQTVPLQPSMSPFLGAGTLFLPYSWALHVACWIQRNNGK